LVASITPQHGLEHLQHTVAMSDSGRMEPACLVNHRVNPEDLWSAVAQLQRPNEIGKVITPAQAPE